MGVCGLRHFHMYVSLAHFLRFKIFNFNIFGGVFRKMNNFVGYPDFVDSWTVLEQSNLGPHCLSMGLQII